MKNRAILVISALASALALSANCALAADQAPAQEKAPTQAKKQAQEKIYGSQLMTQQERAEYRTKMRSANSAEKQDQIRNENHERMKVRAKERGVTLPDELPARGGGMGAGMGAGGSGMGPGGGGAGQGAMPSFSDFDLNKDGKITEDEFAKARAARITDRAQKGYQMRGLSNATSFADIDTNHDGAISPAEFSAHQSLQRKKMGW